MLIRRSDWLIALTTTLASQLYLNIASEGFRFSFAPILLPLLLLILHRTEYAWIPCFLTGGVVFLFRALFYLPAEPMENLPALYFYLVYGLCFTFLAKQRRNAPPSYWFLVMWITDFGANFLEFSLRLSSPRIGFFYCTLLFSVAFLRACLVYLILMLIKRYQLLILAEEHENRYQQFFLMITELKTEILFMQKSTEEIESVMQCAYQLYEQLEGQPELRKLALSLSRDVHEIKKDYLRIIRGVEQTLQVEENTKGLSMQDLLRLLHGYCQQEVTARKLNISLEFHCWHDFYTDKHWMLMSILKNLVDNSIEAIEKTKKSGRIVLWETQKGDACVFQVEDNGPGIAPKYLEHIFDMGFSTKFDTQTGNIYRGVGLAGVKITVEDTLHGKLSVQTKPNHYTRFHIEIPLVNLETEEENDL